MEEHEHILFGFCSRLRLLSQFTTQLSVAVAVAVAVGSDLRVFNSRFMKESYSAITCLCATPDGPLVSMAIQRADSCGTYACTLFFQFIALQETMIMTPKDYRQFLIRYLVSTSLHLLALLSSLSSFRLRCVL
ncbi:unnamed protein product [Ilex paraguariensis]|uniref:CASP-like protein n=1 Tax=Ilex paraguariensis TaxID=185542 RepID=A0ABC8RPX8_9AQUA